MRLEQCKSVLQVREPPFPSPIKSGEPFSWFYVFADSEWLSRAAKALAGLSKWPQCIEQCEAGLKVDGENKELKKEYENAKAKQQAKLDEVGPA